MQRSLIHRIAAFSISLTLAGAASAADTHPAFKVEVTGTGAPIILIPGLASPGEVWDGTVAHYCGGGQHQCHVLTLAGFAGQPAITQPLLPAVERQLSDYIAANKFDRPIIIGHSLGGFLGMKLAADHPEQVGRLVIVDSLPALGATQTPTITREQLRDMAAGMRATMKSQAITSVYTSQYARLQGVKIEMADNARHFIMVDDPAWMYDRIDNFLN